MRAFRPCFELECRALKRVRETMGLTNVQVMVPFVRTRRARRAQVTELLAANGLQARRRRPEDHHDVRAADQRAARRAVPRVLRRHVDRLERHDAAHPRPRPRLGDRRAPASTSATRRCASCCRWPSPPAASTGKYIGICGQGPSDHPDLARWLLDQGIESMSLNPDTVVETWLFLAQPATAAASSPEARA